MDDNKRKALSAALGQIEKQFGKGAVMRMGDVGAVRDIEAISTGSLGLDIALGIGGLPRGRVIEIYGPESSGKTTLTLQVIAEAQKLGGTAAFVDAEHALDPGTLKNWVLMWMSCWSHNPIPVNRRWKLPTCWCVPVPLTWSWSTRSRR